MTVAVIPISRPDGPSSKNPLNPLSKGTRQHLSSKLKQAIEDPSISSIVLYGGKNFCAGADISEFSAKNNSDPKEAIKSSKKIPSIFDITNQIEASTKPVIAAISGVALGGGLELALACHYRVGHTKAKIGLPEVKIGLIPGAGGTQRLPRVCHGGNIAWALNVILTGRMVGMEEAKTVGVMDEIVSQSDDLLEMAKKWASYAELIGDLKYKTVCHKSVFAEDDAKAKFTAGKICDGILKKLPKLEKGGRAAHAAVAAVRASFEKNTFEEGIAVETEHFWDLLLNSAQGRGLRHAFFAERAAQKISGGKGLCPVGKILMDPKGGATVGIIGAGTMGSGIAINFLKAGYKVILVDNNAKGLERGSKLIANVIKQEVKKNRMTSQQAQFILSNNFQTTTDMATHDEFSKCLIVVEAVFENLKIKQSIFKQLNKVVKNPNALLLSNTSTLNIDSIAGALPPGRRQYCAGMHFFSPAHVMKLVEIVVSSSTSKETVSLVQIITAKKLRKVGVVVGNCDGFVGNRMVFPYTGEAVFVLQEGGASVPQVDKAVTSFGMAVGPLNMGDLAGNDIGYLVRKEKGLVSDLKTGLPGPNRKSDMRYTDLGDDLVVKLNRVGQKKLKGWYDYDPKVGRGRKPIPSQEVANFITSYNKGFNVKKYSQQEILERVLFPLVNEGFKILEEGIARKPSDIDIIYLYGYGWPAWRGGPMFWADNEVGLPYLLKHLEEMNSKFPGSTYYAPSALLKKCVALGLTVEAYYDNGHHKSNSKL